MFRILASLVLTVFLLSSLGLGNYAFAQQPTVSGALDMLESALYGKEQKGSLIERINSLEKDLFGMPANEPLLTRVEKLEKYVIKGSSDQASLLFKINALEWTITHNLTRNPLKNRLEDVEKLVQGTVNAEPVHKRVNSLMKTAFAEGQIQTTSVLLPADTLVKVKLITPISSSSTRAGDAVQYQVVDDIIVNSVLVVPAGSMGVGKVTKAEPAKMFGRDAKIEIDFQSVTAIDNSPVATFLGDKAKEQMKSVAMAAGASVAGIALLGPIGIVGGAFIKGDDVTLAADTQLYLQTKAQVSVTGLKI